MSFQIQIILIPKAHLNNLDGEGYIRVHPFNPLNPWLKITNFPGALFATSVKQKPLPGFNGKGHQLVSVFPLCITGAKII